MYLFFLFRRRSLSLPSYSFISILFISLTYNHHFSEFEVRVGRNPAKLNRWRHKNHLHSCVCYSFPSLFEYTHLKQWLCTLQLLVHKKKRNRIAKYRLILKTKSEEKITEKMKLFSRWNELNWIGLNKYWNEWQTSKDKKGSEKERKYR